MFRVSGHCQLPKVLSSLFMLAYSWAFLPDSYHLSVCFLDTKTELLSLSFKMQPVAVISRRLVKVNSYVSLPNLRMPTSFLYFQVYINDTPSGIFCDLPFCTIPCFLKFTHVHTSVLLQSFLSNDAGS